MASDMSACWSSHQWLVSSTHNDTMLRDNLIKIKSTICAMIQHGSHRDEIKQILNMRVKLTRHLNMMKTMKALVPATGAPFLAAMSSGKKSHEVQICISVSVLVGHEQWEARLSTMRVTASARYWYRAKLTGHGKATREATIHA